MMPVPSTPTILVPLDVSADSDRSALFDLARQMAEMHDARLVFLTVVPELYLPTATDPQSVIAAVTNQATRQLRSALADRWPDPGAIRALVRYGPVSGTIIETARELGADLILMHACRAGIASYALGSVASRVVNHADASVYVLREKGGAA